MSTGTLIKVDGTVSRKFTLNESVEILQQRGSQYQAKNSKGITGWVYKNCISLDGGGPGKARPVVPAIRSNLKTKPPIPMSKPKPAMSKPKLTPAIPVVKPKSVAPTQMPTLAAHEKQKVPPCFTKDKCSGIYNLSWNLMNRLLLSYGITDKNEIAKLINWWRKNLISSPFKLNAIPAVLTTALGRKNMGSAQDKIYVMRGDQTKKYVAKQNSAAAPPLSGKKITELSRAGSRTYSEVRSADGFHGWGGSRSVVHARIWAKEYWEPMSQSKKNTWLFVWKDHTRDKTDAMPFVATGWSSQKAGHSLKIEVPIEIKKEKDAVMYHDHPSINKSNVFCIAGSDEVVFLTGIPMKYINKP